MNEKLFTIFQLVQIDIWVCSLAWIGQRPPEPLTRVQIPADPSKTSLFTQLIIYQKNINSYYNYSSYGNYEL